MVRPSLFALALALLLGGCLLDSTGLHPGDADGDGDGDGDADADADVDEEPDGDGPCRPEVCNYRDDDCDGTTDDGFDLAIDPENCGQCGFECGMDPPFGESRCLHGECVIVCEPGREDCTGAEPGCETDLSSPESCGDCDTVCLGESSFCRGTPLAGYECVAECEAPEIDCGGTCTDVDVDPANCGGCGDACTAPAHAEATCADGRCGFACDEGWGDCDDEAPGCETSLTTLEDCGGCGDECTFRHAAATCATGTCQIEACAPGWADCDHGPSNGCERDVYTSNAHCGECGASCAGGEDCVFGICTPAACPGACVCRGRCSVDEPCECADSCPCVDLECDADCDVACAGAGTLCVIDATAVDDFDLFSCAGGAFCFVDLTGSDGDFEGGRCRDGGTYCLLNCTEASSCSPSCMAGAECVLDCTSAGDCRFEVCDGVLTDCGGDVWACNTVCPR